MKILVATDCYIYNLGGITASVLALIKGLRRQGHEVRTLALSDTNRSFRQGDDYFIRSFPAFYYPGLRMSFAVRDPLLKELEAWDPDIIHVQTEGSARRLSERIRKHCRAPMVMTCHTDYGYFIFRKMRNLPPVRALLSASGRFLYRHAARVTAPSLKAAEFPFLRWVHGRVTVVPNGMEIEKYRNRFSAEERLAFRRSLGIADAAEVLVCVSRLSREKNIRELIAFLPGLRKARPDAVLLIVGDGPDREYLERMAGSPELRGCAVFTGRVPSDDVWRYYSAGDLFVSASAFEVHSMSYLEAVANGLPLLCREDDALRGVLDPGGNGFVYRSEEEFVHSARRLLEDGALRKEMGLRSARKAEDFSYDAFAASMAEIYTDALRQSPRSGKKEPAAPGV